MESMVLKQNHGFVWTSENQHIQPVNDSCGVEVLENCTIRTIRIVQSWHQAVSILMLEPLMVQDLLMKTRIKDRLVNMSSSCLGRMRPCPIVEFVICFQNSNKLSNKTAHIF